MPVTLTLYLSFSAFTMSVAMRAAEAPALAEDKRWSLLVSVSTSNSATLRRCRMWKDREHRYKQRSLNTEMGQGFVLIEKYLYPASPAQKFIELLLNVLQS